MPSAAMVYEIALEGSLVMVPVNITTAGAHALFLEYGGDQVETNFVSPSGVVLVAAAEEAADEVEEEEEEEQEGEGEEDGGSSATVSQWANAIAASVIISVCRLESWRELPGMRQIFFAGRVVDEKRGRWPTNCVWVGIMIISFIRTNWVTIPFPFGKPLRQECATTLGEVSEVPAGTSAVCHYFLRVGTKCCLAAPQSPLVNTTNPNTARQTSPTTAKTTCTGQHDTELFR